MKRDLKYYTNLNYPIEIRKIPEDEGGGYCAEIPQLGRFAFVGDGDTVEESLDNLEAVKSDLFADYLKRGIPIPEPEIEVEEQYSGRFVVRVPKALHALLSKQAKKNECSLNQYVTTLLSTAVVAGSIEELVNNKVLQIGRVLEFSEPKFYVAKREKPSDKIEPVQPYRRAM